MLITDHHLLNYKRCNRRTYLDVYGSLEHRDPEKDFLLKLKRENLTHIAKVIATRNLNYHQPQASRSQWQLNSQQTIELMQQGVDCIFQGTLSLTFTQWQTFLGSEVFEVIEPNLQNLLSETIFLVAPSLLIKQPGKSKFGAWEYLSVNIKLGRRAKPEYKLIGAFHAQILGIIQEKIPAYSQLILKEHQDYLINLDHWLTKMQQITAECWTMLAKQQEPEVFISRQRCNLCNWYSYCYGVAKSSKHLSLVPGITPTRYEYLQEIEVNSVEALNNVPEVILGELIGDDVARLLKQQISALKSDRPIIRSDFDVVNTPPIPTGVIEIYFDIEAEPELQIDYLLGVLVVNREANTEEFYAFLAEQPAAEGKIWQQFVDFIALYPDAPIFHYSEYEVDTIKRLARLYHTPVNTTQEILSRLVDIHEWVTKSVVLPVESYSLKALANWIGFYWRETQGSGDQSVCWYDQWLHTQDRVLLELILSYNEDDCRATRHLKDWLLDFLEYQRNQQIAVN
jgi:predicted RecB family nuclease